MKLSRGLGLFDARSRNPLLIDAIPSLFIEGAKLALSEPDMKKRPEFARKEASWGRTLVQQPPALECAFLGSYQTRQGERV